MRYDNLFIHLMGLEPGQKIPFNSKITPSTESYSFLSEGHAMEYIRFGPDAKKVVRLFFEPDEFVVSCHGSSPLQKRKILHLIWEYR